MSPQSPDSPAVFVIKGTEPALVDRGVNRLLAQLTSSNDQPADEESPAGAAATAAAPSRSR
jgi:hypothetical protein